MVSEIKCESCGAVTNELFEKKNKWVCINCTEKTRMIKGRTVETRPPQIGRGIILDRSKRNAFIQRPDGK